MTKDCLYCGLQFPNTTRFCSNCGRRTESGFSIRLIQESELERLRREVKEKDELIRQLLLTRAMCSEASHGAARSIDRRDHYDSDGRRAVLSSGRS
jgi:predicted amidophosphoribosyltransferase